MSQLVIGMVAYGIRPCWTLYVGRGGDPLELVNCLSPVKIEPVIIWEDNSEDHFNDIKEILEKTCPSRLRPGLCSLPTLDIRRKIDWTDSAYIHGNCLKAMCGIINSIRTIAQDLKVKWVDQKVIGVCDAEAEAADADISSSS